MSFHIAHVDAGVDADARLVQIPAGHRPADRRGDGSLLAVWTICLWAALLAGIFAVAEDGRLTMVAVVPVVANLAICALLGTSSGFYRMAIGTIMAVVLVVWVSARWKLLELGRWLSSVVIVLLASAVAIGGCLVVGQNRTILRDHYDPPLSPYDYTSPLSGMRSYIKNHKDDVLLTVDDLPAGSTVRLAVMDRFDGNVEPVRFHHGFGFLQLPSCGRFHRKQRRRQAVHREIHGR